MPVDSLPATLDTRLTTLDEQESPLSSPDHWLDSPPSLPLKRPRRVEKTSSVKNPDIKDSASFTLSSCFKDLLDPFCILNKRNFDTLITDDDRASLLALLPRCDTVNILAKKSVDDLLLLSDSANNTALNDSAAAIHSVQFNSLKSPSTHTQCQLAGDAFSTHLELREGVRVLQDYMRFSRLSDVSEALRKTPLLPIHLLNRIVNPPRQQDEDWKDVNFEPDQFLPQQEVIRYETSKGRALGSGNRNLKPMVRFGMIKVGDILEYIHKFKSVNARLHGRFKVLAVCESGVIDLEQQQHQLDGELPLTLTRVSSPKTIQLELLQRSNLDPAISRPDPWKKVSVWRDLDRVGSLSTLWSKLNTKNPSNYSILDQKQNTQTDKSPKTTTTPQRPKRCTVKRKF